MAHQLGGFYNMPHGVANAILLPYIMEDNSSSCKERFAAVAGAMGVKTAGLTNDQASGAAIDAVRRLSEDVGIPTLASLGFKPEDAVTLSINATNDTCIVDNPKEATVMDVQAIYMNAYLGK